MPKSKHDIIVFGATSFVGKILSHYLIETYGKELNWAAAGRSQAKLDTLKAELGEAGAHITTIAADAGNEADMQALCAQTKVIISTVGPYALFGEPLLKACVESGTDYCDLTGEVQWVSQMIKRYEEQAKASGARIVHSCGFDSIPSDLGVHYLQSQAKKTFGEYCNQVRMVVWRIKGGASGGTIASALNAVKEAASDPAVRKDMANPYALCPAGAPNTRQLNVSFVQKHSDVDTWVGPFVMAGVNTRVVHRSHALQNYAWGEDFKYDESMSTGRGPAGIARAASMCAGLAAVFGGAAFASTRKLVEKILPSPGEGPSPQEQLDGYYDLRFIGHTKDGKIITTKVYGDRDPGYGSTGKKLGEAGACLAFDLPKDKYPGGFWTPASLMGDKLIQRLEEKAGLSFEVLS
ncbi:MAG: saccharopine dehydrogenase family protein [Oceanococcus sp.]